jgi:predicted transcriptional regulator with HTH domain
MTAQASQLGILAIILDNEWRLLSSPDRAWIENWPSRPGGAVDTPATNVPLSDVQALVELGHIDSRPHRKPYRLYKLTESGRKVAEFWVKEVDVFGTAIYHAM